MKTFLIFLQVILFLYGCNQENQKVNPIEIKSLSDLVNENWEDRNYYQFTDFDINNRTPNAFVLVLPSSSCFNCFEDLNIVLNKWFTNKDRNIIIIKNDLVKEREIYSSMENVVSKEKISIFQIQNEFIKQHEFFPKVGFYQNGKICCLEVIEQGKTSKLQEYMEFLSHFFLENG